MSGEPPGPRAGAVIAGRYRLIASVGNDVAAGAGFWRARDLVLDRDVALTLLLGGSGDEPRASAALARELRSARFDHPARARVLDVISPDTVELPPGVLGAAVAEWTAGPSLAELVAGGPLRPTAALRVLEPLAAAVGVAHRAGVVLGCDHPQRVRLATNTTARVAFPLPRSEVRGDDDVRGLGAALYLLLTAHWPLDPGRPPPAGLRAAPRDPDGSARSARELRRTVPVEVTALVDRVLDPTSGVRTSTAVHRVLCQLLDTLQDDSVLLPVAEDGVQVGRDTHTVWYAEGEVAAEFDPGRRRKLQIGMSLVALATVLALGWAGFEITAPFRDTGGSGLPALVVGAPSSPTRPPTGRPSTAPGPQPVGAPVPAADVEVYDPSGDPDNPSRVSRLIDGNPATSWRTLTYRQQFPALKPGVGVMITFASPVRVASVLISSPSAGTRIEVRAAAGPNIPLAQTVLLSSGTLGSGLSEIRLQAGDPTGHLLLWITELGGGAGSNVTELDEVVLQRAAP